jgi:hypothetical protein
MNHLYTIIWLHNMDKQKEIKKQEIQKNKTSNATPNKIIKKARTEPQVNKELYNSDDIEKLLLIM